MTRISAMSFLVFKRTHYSNSKHRNYACLIRSPFIGIYILQQLCTQRQMRENIFFYANLLDVIVGVGMSISFLHGISWTQWWILSKFADVHRVIRLNYDYELVKYAGVWHNFKISKALNICLFVRVKLRRSYYIFFFGYLSDMSSVNVCRMTHSIFF